MRDCRKRSFVKAICWRAIATSTTVVLVFLFTGEVELAASIGVLDVTSKLLFYYAHERVWDRITWGKEKG